MTDSFGRIDSNELIGTYSEHNDCASAPFAQPFYWGAGGPAEHYGGGSGAEAPPSFVMMGSGVRIPLAAPGISLILLYKLTKVTLTVMRSACQSHATTLTLGQTARSCLSRRANVSAQPSIHQNPCPRGHRRTPSRGQFSNMMKTPWSQPRPLCQLNGFRVGPDRSRLPLVQRCRATILLA
jgi:hypothetical protein